MDLFCFEKENYPRGVNDPTFLDDERVLSNLRQLENAYMINCSYFERVQTEIEPYMRKAVADWMLEVCCSEQCEDEVFPLAMNLMDRFLSLVNIRKSQLQLLGSVCLLLASKLRESRAIKADNLIMYTDYSITLEEITDWEILVLCKLKWDLAAITPNDFLNLLLRRLRPIIAKREDLIRKHAQIFIALCSTDETFIGYPPSLIAAASIKTAMEGLFNLQQKIMDQIQNRNQQVDYVNSIAKLIQSKENVKPVLFKLSSMIEQRCNQEKAMYSSTQATNSTSNVATGNQTQLNLPPSPAPSSQSSSGSCSPKILEPNNNLLNLSTSPISSTGNHSPICKVTAYSDSITSSSLITEQVK